MTDISKQIKSVISTDIITILVMAAIGFFGARVLHSQGLRRVAPLAPFPELSDILLMVIGYFALPGNYRVGIVAGTGISLADNLLRRAGVRIS
ncbi:MAG: hypothetical protein DDT31_01612 [Syntrophomonadaceae bacterium]|nr:hypothetical protein [Bacillota bacterium]